MIVSPCLFLTLLEQVPGLLKSSPRVFRASEDLPNICNRFIQCQTSDWLLFELTEGYTTQSCFCRFVDEYSGNIAFQAKDIQTVYPPLLQRIHFIHQPAGLNKLVRGKGVTGKEKSYTELLGASKMPWVLRKMLLQPPSSNFQKRILALLDQA